MPNVARSVDQRRQVVALLAGKGMSQRAIADAVGVSQKTVDRVPRALWRRGGADRELAEHLHDLCGGQVA